METKLKLKHQKTKTPSGQFPPQKTSPPETRFQDHENFFFQKTSKSDKFVT